MTTRLLCKPNIEVVSPLPERSRALVLHAFLTLHSRLAHAGRQIFIDIYTLHPIHLDARIWDEDGNNEAIMLPYQTINGASIDDVINTILQFQATIPSFASELAP